jgi:sodium-dependent dicarboxylate transporter 2/3/5
LLADTGLAETLGTGIADALGFSSLLAVSAVSAIIANLISETTSNTASATIVVPMVIPIASAAGLDPLVPALAAVFGASFGFMMPVSTPQNAVVYGSGMIPITKMVRSGIVFDIIGLILIVSLIPVMAGLTLA